MRQQHDTKTELEDATLLECVDGTLEALNRLNGRRAELWDAEEQVQRQHDRLVMEIEVVLLEGGIPIDRVIDVARALWISHVELDILRRHSTAIVNDACGKAEAARQA